ncbi:MAG: hypothetical protein COV99_07385 [Bacteroidetes bacterium CG12_big_fil_rev_8_21_14_0_65_60_17]|nr:MAG: hypothetical protein COV99_07385 [Bacteroidetes bacterium CG12_big_fil_rev_8_21_14_0_65_60_17]
MVLATGVLVLQGHTFGLQGSLEYALVRQFAKRYIYQHGIDFNEALELWNDPYMIEWPARSTGESRRAITGVARGKLWMAIMRLRGDVDWRPPDRNIASNGPTLAPIRHNSSAFPHLSRM